MATINCVTVLTPNGRRQSVRVTPNSTILQILEEVCNKHEFDPLEYDIKHHNKILDTTMTMQFSRLPNNAQLEMVKAKKIRRESEVLVNVQVESGERLSGTFLPSESLWEVTAKLCPELCSDNKQPTIVYMRQEICGMENLKATTLRALGLTSGRALLRFTCKIVEGEVPKQPGVTSTLTNYGVASAANYSQAKFTDLQVIDSTKQTMNKDKNYKERFQKNSTNVGMTSEQSTEPTTSVVGSQKKGVETKAGGNKVVSHEETKKSIVIQHSPGKSESSVIKKKHAETSPPQSHCREKHQEVKPAHQEQTNSDSLEKLLEAEIEPRDRNAVVFKHGSHQSSAGEDLPDEFFDLTIDDVQHLYRDLKCKLSEMDEAPLQTAALRKLEESKRILNNLHKYKRTVLRIQFPDQIIVQGSFSPVETIENVHEFVRGYLQDPSVSFHLFTTPPKEILSPSSRLIEVNCVPCALLHFGLPNGIQENTQYLRADVLHKLSSPEEATAAATASRGLPATSEKRTVPSTSGTQQPRASTSGVQTPKEKKSSGTNNKADTIPTGGPNGKVPKWFKVGPK